ncbi:MAG: hypothetical protein FWH12_01220 [Treponema sp.]|nr:hypothetical protein [Treponema sp.]
MVIKKLAFYSCLVILLFSSCLNRPVPRRIFDLSDHPRAVEIPGTLIVMDHQNQGTRNEMPEWVTAFLEGGLREVETLEEYEGTRVFVSRNEGISFPALAQWREGFSAELDFPLLASRRIEERFLLAAEDPETYGSFFPALIRAASDFPWEGPQRAGDFWIRWHFIPDPPDPEDLDDPYDTPMERISWEFLILVTIEEQLFASQFQEILRSLNPIPPPSRDQVSDTNRVIDSFFEGF